ncbi:demethylmenaquinone methyltransferase / 2-methoxy-6-polyprenyl-1,4-benzoquinol methylase [Geoalkalibacter ferrihydriticus]|uniref:Demethylmenaquinone methyltransferase / 2-methoxy-6-polyprenyl-1,4-benzoquinol methylase n=1 Tax=Geoalkalibacter ferrihydriticus TaxID=392333 RepID=A0A1G9MNK6_9BACT|nr:class I SAM-dependent methyltransferase [Geoalkalibacter ferrihydriticus]SDL75611.1 demethylmenaquinone methyltransferase / 2-methoxy-6-polyprenyl-1,4-benzoquinol methylase [Geoalkalibacter ferrihydriticus]
MNGHFDLLAPIYDRLLGPPNPAVWRALLKLPVQGCLLDAGGGTGRVCAALADQATQTVVCDLSRKMLRKTTRKGHLLPVQADVAHLPFTDHHFQRIVVVDALHHFPHQQAAVAELVRVLAPGGRLVIEEFDIARLPIKALALLERLLLMGSYFPPVEEIVAMIETCGLRGDIRRDGLAVRVVVDK